MEHSAGPQLPPLDALPPPVSRPVQWKRLQENLSILRSGDTSKVLTAAYSVGDAFGGMANEHHLHRLYASALGRELIERRESLGDALGNHEALAAMPPESLGRHYLDFSNRHGINVSQLLSSQHAMSRDYANLDPLRRWLSDRLTVSHDLWHVLVGYEASPAGESALMCFSLPQRINDRTLPIFVLMSVTSGKIRVRDAAAAFERGRRARYLTEQPFERLLPLPLEAVREKLGISPLRVAHADGAVPQMLIPQTVRGSN